MLKWNGDRKLQVAVAGGTVQSPCVPCAPFYCIDPFWWLITLPAHLGAWCVATKKGTGSFCLYNCLCRLGGMGELSSLQEQENRLKSSLVKLLGPGNLVSGEV